MVLGFDGLDDDGAALLEGVPRPLLPGDGQLEGDDDASKGRHTLLPHLAVNVAILFTLLRLAFLVELLLLLQKGDLSGYKLL